MNRIVAVVCLVAAGRCAAVAGEIKIEYASTGTDFVADVEAVLAPFALTAEQAEKIDAAKKEFVESRDMLLADFVTKFTNDIGNADVVFAKLADETRPKGERADLKAKVDKFASTEGRKFRSAALLLEGNAKREIARALGTEDAAKFNVALIKRQGLRSSTIGRCLLKMEEAAPALKLDAAQSEKLDKLLADLKERQQAIVEEYQKAFTEQQGTDDVRRILSEGTAEEKAELTKRMTALRTQLAEEIEAKSNDAIAAFKRSLNDLLSQEQREQLEKMME